MPVSPLETLVFEGPSAEKRVARLGLSVDGLTQSILEGEYARMEAVEDDPITAAGTDAYRYRVRALRQTFKPQGWTRGTDRGLEKTQSPDGKVVVITRGGDSGVGFTDAFPQPQGKVGEAGEKAADKNASLALDPNWFNVGQAQESEFETWMLLVHRQKDTVRAELSLPSEVKNGRVSAWIERIILPNIDLADDLSKKQSAPEPVVAEPSVARKR